MVRQSKCNHGRSHLPNTISQHLMKWQDDLARKEGEKREVGGSRVRKCQGL